jgi:uncharacterized Zn-binding protein involved in type VI secretion
MLGKPAARVGDAHACPMADPKPHVGGPIVGPGAATVLIGGQAAALAGDQCICAGPVDLILPSQSRVIVLNRPIAKLGDLTAHGGSILSGCPTVIVGG